MNKITLPVISAYSEKLPEDFQKGKILAVLSNVRLIYRTSIPEGKRHSGTPVARKCFLSCKDATAECDPNRVYLKFSSNTRQRGQKFSMSKICKQIKVYITIVPNIMECTISMSPFSSNTSFYKWEPKMG